jgi:hypothetical protein
MDWVHNALQDGTWTVEAFLFIVACGPFGVTMEGLQAYMRSTFKFPKHRSAKGGALHQIFSASRNWEAKLRCSASEALSMYPLLRHYVELHVELNPILAAKRASFDAACVVLDIILMAKRGLIPMAAAGQQLRAAVADHITKHVLAYGADHIKPKHHWMFDVAEQFERDPFVLDQFVIERKHLTVKTVASLIDNTRCFERSVLAGVILQQRRQLGQGDVVQNALEGKTAPLCGRPDARLGDRLCIDGCTISVGDVVICDGTAGKILACVAEGQGLFVMADEMQLERVLSRHSQRWRLTGSLVLWPAASLEQVIAWIPAGPLLTVVRMPE